MIFLYRIINTLILPATIALLLLRAARGKELLYRIKERFGIASITRPKGEILWCHAASIGETNAALTLLEQIRCKWPNLQFLLTTGTVTSAEIVQKHLQKLSLKEKPYLYHQFLPHDEYFSVQRFLKHWQPKCSIFIESELWPNLLSLTKQVCPIALVNARMSQRSFKRWSYVPALAKFIVSHFDQIIAQSPNDASTYSKLGAQNVSVGLNLKFFNPKLSVDEENLVKLKQQIKGRIIISLVSTHEGDEKLLLPALIRLKKDFPNILYILAPRHMDRVEKIQDLLHSSSLNTLLKSSKQEIQSNTDIYIVDSIGELGTIFSLSNLSIIGGSFNNGGHNPLEPAHFGNTIMWGPDMTNFALIAEEMLAHEAAIRVSSENDLYTQIHQLFSTNQQQLDTLSSNAIQFIQKQANQHEQYCSMLKPLIDDD